jgi:hypothetical protein
MNIGKITIPISRCTIGIYLRWYWNGWHYFNFTNGYEINLQTNYQDIQVTRFFSVISKIERPTSINTDYAYQVTVEGIPASNIEGFNGLIMSERVEQYESGLWREVEITRGEHLLKDNNSPAYELSFQITRKELPVTSSVYQRKLKLYIGDTLCDLDDTEVIPLNKQENDIAEMQDRQSDFSASFNIRKTKPMMALFELSGEVGANTTFPYKNQTCRLIQDNIEVITNGIIILLSVSDQYYSVSILSGNLNFFKEIENKKIGDLTLVTTNHVWNAVNAAASNASASGSPYVYPMCEPSDDGSIAPLTDDGSKVEMYAGWIWPFINVKTIWDEIFTNAGYICKGDILNNSLFKDLYIPISNLKVTKAVTDKYLYSLNWYGSKEVLVLSVLDFFGSVLINGDLTFQSGHYIAPFTGKYKFRISVVSTWGSGSFQLFSGGAYVGTFVINPSLGFGLMGVWDYEYTAAAGEDISFKTPAGLITYYTLSVIEITDAKIGYSSSVTPRLHLPDLTQVDFIKMICNMFGLIPNVTPRDKIIYFWNYSDLYNNIAIARDWSAYLSERDDVVEFKFGEYAQSNYLKYKDSEDVILDNGKGTLLIDDETLPSEKNVVEIPVSTCDEVIVVTDVPVSRIAFNKWNGSTSVYDQNDSIDPRIVFVKKADGTKTFSLRATIAPGGGIDTVSPKYSDSIDVSFSHLVTNYAWLSRILTKTNLRKTKFNLPIHEVSGLKHYIPIYLKQYKAYFYVNLISNYVPGQLCDVDLIKL